MTIQSLLSDLGVPGKHPLPPFPPTFLFGVGTADHQCEAYDPDVEDVRDVWEREHHLTPRGRATDFRNRYREDIELARQMGCTAFRISIAWSRVEPEPGVFSRAELEHYQRVVIAIREADMEPVVTLHHFTWPLHIETRGGMICPDFPELYGRYVLEVVRYLGQDVRYWIPFNEPSQLLFGYIKPWWVDEYFAPPGMPPDSTMDDEIDAVGHLIHNLFVAHTKARTIIKQNNSQAQVGSNPLLLGLPIWLQRFVNWNAMRLQNMTDLRLRLRGCGTPPPIPAVIKESPLLGERLRRLFEPMIKTYTILSTIIASNWWHLGMAGKLPTFLCPPECVGQQDFVGVDYYWGIGSLQLNRVGALLESSRGHFDHAPVWPTALYGHLKYLAGLFPKLPLLIVENGSVDTADGIDRVSYLRKHIEQVQLALHHHIDVIGYLCWSITSNREWGLPFNPGSDFGLYHIDLDGSPNLERTPTPAVLAYKSIISGGKTLA
ncbi:MAG TPA: family 1 glycosylhydrolase [Anaerolineae bacterium]